MNRFGICLLLGTLVGCGAQGLEQEGESLGSTSEALVSTRVVASDTTGKLYGSSSGSTSFSGITIAPGTQAASVEGGGGGVVDGDYYVSKTGQLYERTTASQWQQKFGATTFVDITTGGGVTLATNDAGRIVRKADAQNFEYVEELQVRETPEGGIIPVSRIDVCANGTIWAVSTDGFALYRYEGAGPWIKDALAGIGGIPNTVPSVLDVGCDVGGEFIVAARAPRPGGVFRRHHGAWVKIAAGQALFSASRVDVDSTGNVWFVGADSFNGPKLWRTDYLGSNLAFANVPNPFDVGG